MEKYRKVEKPKQNDAEKEDNNGAVNVVRINHHGAIHSYANYCQGTLTTDKTDVTLKALGQAISKAISVAELLKQRVPNLHQVTRISSLETVDEYEPLEEGLDVVKVSKRIPCISIHLSVDVSLVDSKDPGYQKPLPLDQVRASTTEQDAVKVPQGKPRKKTNKLRTNGRNGKDSRNNEQEKEESVVAEVDNPSAPFASKKKPKKPMKNDTDSNAKNEVPSSKPATDDTENKTTANTKKTNLNSNNSQSERGTRSRDRGNTRGGRTPGRGRGKHSESGDEQSAVETRAEEHSSNEESNEVNPSDNTSKRGGRGRRGRGGRVGFRGRGRGRGEGKLFDSGVNDSAKYEE